MLAVTDNMQGYLQNNDPYCVYIKDLPYGILPHGMKQNHWCFASDVMQDYFSARPPLVMTSLVVCPVCQILPYKPQEFCHTVKYDGRKHYVLYDSCKICKCSVRVNLLGYCDFLSMRDRGEIDVIDLLKLFAKNKKGEIIDRL